jgi:hypothetical protein
MAGRRHNLAQLEQAFFESPPPTASAGRRCSARSPRAPTPAVAPGPQGGLGAVLPALPRARRDRRARLPSRCSRRCIS